jgi:hypothetical protein
VARRGGPRTTVGLPGTGLSWSLEHSPDPAPAASDPPRDGRSGSALPNSRKLRSSQLQELQGQLLALLQQRLFAAANGGRRLWEEGLVSRLLAQEAPGSRQAGLLALIETPEAMQSYLERSRSQADARRRAQRCVTAFSLATRLAGERGWLN